MRRLLVALLPALWLGCGEEPTPPVTRSIPVITEPAPGTSGRLKVTVRGTAEPGRAVEVFVGGSNPVRAYSTESGTFEAADLPLGGQGGRAIWARMADDTTLVSVPVVVTMNYTALATPVIFFPIHGAAIPAGAVPLAGRAPYGVSEVEIFRDGARIATVGVDRGGFLLSAFDPSGSGRVELWARGILAGGGYTACSESIAVIVGGGEAPTVQAITQPSADTATNTLGIAVEGSCSGSHPLALIMDGGLTTLRSAPSGGAFSFAPVSLVAEGVHVLGIVSMRAGGGVAEDAVRLWVDLTAPPVPVIVRPTEDEVHRIPEVAVEGATEPGAIVTLMLDGSAMPDLVADARGVFAQTLSLPGDGSYALVARAEDAVGNRSASSAERTIVVDSAAPSAPTLTTPVAGTLLTTDTFLVSGTAQTGSWLEILVDGGVADALVSGERFNVTMATPSPDGAHRIGVRASSAPGAGWVRGDSVSFSVDLTPPPPPTILQPADSAVISAFSLALSGASEPRATVRVLVGEEELTQIPADANGAWRVTVPAPEADGVFTLRAMAVDSAGHSGSWGAPHMFFVDRTPPPLQISTPAPDALFSANPVTVAGTTEAGATVAVDGVTVTFAGSTFQTAVFLAEGLDTVVVRAKDDPGNCSTLRLPLRLDTIPPTITLSSPPESLITQSSSVTVAGTTEIGSAVTIQGSPVGVDAAGAFSGVVSLPQGWTTITVVAADEAGWTGRQERHVVRDAPPTAPTALRPDAGAFCTTGKPTLAVSAATDPNGDVLWHTMEIYADASMTQRLAQSPPLQATSGTVSWMVGPELPLSGGTRYWRAKAFDGLLWGPWSAVATFRLPDIGSRQPHRVLGYGDSITGGAQTQNGGWVWCEGYREDLQLALTAFFGDALVETNYVGGGSSAAGAAGVQDTLAGRTNAYLLILFGTIDALASNPPVNPQTVKANVATVAAYARSIGMVAVVGTLPPTLNAETNLRVQQINALLRQLADGNGTLVADHYTRFVEVAAGTLSRVICEDGVHPSDLGYSVMAEVWYRALTGSDAYPLGDVMARAARSPQP